MSVFVDGKIVRNLSSDQLNNKSTTKMIRIYLDWSVVTNFKKDEFIEIREFIAKHKDYLLFPYTPAHFKDLMKGYNLDNEHFQQDLRTLEYLSEKHLLKWGEDGIEGLFGTPQEYFEREKKVSTFL